MTQMRRFSLAEANPDGAKTWRPSSDHTHCGGNKVGSESACLHDSVSRLIPTGGGGIQARGTWEGDNI